MRKLLPETMRRREETKRRMEECGREWDNAMSRLDELACKTPQDPYSDERDYSMEGANDGTMEGNQMKMREALVKVLRLANVTADGENWDWNNAIAENVVKVVKEALSAPPRNCDVGTAEEQETRFNDYCRKHYDLTFDLDSDPCKACPFFAIPGCRFAWAQMPYEAKEGGADGK